MSRFARLTIITCSILALAAPAAARQDPADTAIRAAEEQLAAALIAGDEAAFERLLLPSFVLRGSPDVPRATWVANALGRCWGTQADVSGFSVISRDGDAAVVGLVLTTNLNPDTCQPAVVRSLLTDVWRLDNGAWRLAMRHSGPAGGGVAAQFSATRPPPPIVEGTAELSLVNTGGNSDTQTLGAAGSLIWRPDGWTTRARASFVRTATESVETARQVVFFVEQSRAINDRLDAFTRFELRRNRFAGITRRLSIDAGLGYRPVDTAAHVVRLSAGIGYSNEDRVNTPTVSGAIINIGGDWRWNLTSTSTLREVTLITASLDDGEDWRLGNTLSLATELNNLFSVKLTHELKFANRPAPGFKKTDTILSAALVASF